MLRLAAAILLFGASASVAVTVVTARLRGSYLPTLETVLVPSSGAGVTVTPGAGRVLLVDSVPEGGIITIGGTVVGQTPWSSDWQCTPGKPVQVLVERPGYLAQATTVGCQEGSTRIAVTLESAR